MRISIALTILLVVLLLAGCGGANDPVETERTAVEQTTDTETPRTQAPAETCTPIGGEVLYTVPVEGNVSDENVTDYESLPAEQRDVFPEMVEGYYEARRLALEDFPEYVRYNGTVYELKFGGWWDEFC